MNRRGYTAGELVVEWVEAWCTVPGGRPVRLSAPERAAIYTLFDAQVLPTEPITGSLAAYLALFALAGPEAWPGERELAPPWLETDIFTLWSAAGPDLRRFLERRGDRLTCPHLGTVWAAA